MDRIGDFEQSSGKSIWRDCMTCTISHLSGIIYVKIINVIEIEYSKT